MAFWGRTWGQVYTALVGWSRMTWDKKLWKNKVKRGYGGRLGMVSEALLLSNTKTGKNPPQQIVGREPTGDFGQRLLRLTQFLR